MPSASAVPSLFEVRDYELGYGENMVFRCPYLNLKPGETLTLLGASGTGKTTFFSGLAGHLESSRGQLSQNGEVVSRDWQLRKVARTLQDRKSTRLNSSHLGISY